jgi:hypothetical protein
VHDQVNLAVFSNTGERLFDHGNLFRGERNRRLAFCSRTVHSVLPRLWHHLGPRKRKNLFEGFLTSPKKCGN